MATATPLLKGLITASVLAALGAVGWNIYKSHNAEQATPVAANVAPQKAVTTGGAAPAAKATPSQGIAGIGGSSNPLKVSIVSFHGYAPALVANGNSLETKSGSIYSKEGVNVKFLLQDDVPTLSTLFEAGTAHCAWRTTDFWAQDQPNLRNANLDGRAVMVVDNTQGADAIISAKADIQRVEDLGGKKLALLQFTPSHGMAIDAIENSSMTAKKKSSVNYVFINAEEGTTGVRAALESGAVDAVALWDPDLSLAVKNVKGAHVVYSTKTASNLIYDIMVCDKRVIDNPEGKKAIQKFVNGWMDGIAVSKANPDLAVEALVATEELFGLLAKKEGKPFIKGLFPTLIWTDLEQNARVLGLNGQQGHYARVYTRFDQIYRAAGALANPKSPVIAPQDSVDTSFIQNLLNKNAEAVKNSAKPEFTFTEAAKVAAVSKVAEVTKPVMVNFTTGSAELSKRAQQVIDTEMVPFIENNGSAYFEISGNTDSTGSRETNMRLSVARATSVATYLHKQWEIPSARFKVVGNGPDKPICNEGRFAEEGLTFEQCQAMNRSTRVAVFGK